MAIFSISAISVNLCMVEFDLGCIIGFRPFSAAARQLSLLMYAQSPTMYPLAGLEEFVKLGKLRRVPVMPAGLPWPRIFCRAGLPLCAVLRTILCPIGRILRCVNPRTHTWRTRWSPQSGRPWHHHLQTTLSGAAGSPGRPRICGGGTTIYSTASSAHTVPRRPGAF